ncbi:lipopolysaccharide biosynthesis protein [Acinetobacter schindleri]|uniref:lipopolysaccharide biosynthesis protein n=1 Tax=Acinetobacter schindleri TaxID=108981 RepID=UPI000972B4C9|nr:sugar transporter [Acinetobacter schindleri]APX64135.1 polysaccharide biosynthesis protein [Acinetobacter schindleri]
MENVNRTSKVLINAKISLLFFLILLFLSFVSRSVFIKFLGTEILGLNTIATNLVGFLNLAELGISAAIASSLYKPLSENNKKEIREIITVQGWLYRKIAYLIMFLACVLMLFFPIIFQKTHLPLWYAYSIFSALLISSLLTYFINYKQVLLIADMKEYKIILSIRSTQIVKIILQILAIIYLDNGFIYWVILELLYGLVSSFVLKKIINREYPWLNISVSEGGDLRIRHPYIIKHTKQLFFHKFAGFVLLQTTPLIIYAYVGLTMVSVYDNYMMIILGIATLLNAIFSSFQPGIGNLVATGNREKILSFFSEYASLRFWIASVVCVVLYYQATGFITLWVGKGYVLDTVVFSWLVIYLFIMLTRVFDPFIYAYALYGDIYAPIIEAMINLSLSVVLGYFFGLSGILAGVIISLLVVIYLWRPYYVFNRAFKANLFIYYKGLLYYGLCIFFAVSLSGFLLNKIYLTKVDLLSFILNSFLVLICYSFLSLILFYTFVPEFRRMIFRVILVLKLDKIFKII